MGSGIKGVNEWDGETFLLPIYTSLNFDRKESLSLSLSLSISLSLSLYLSLSLSLSLGIPFSSSIISTLLLSISLLGNYSIAFNHIGTFISLIDTLFFYLSHKYFISFFPSLSTSLQLSLYLSLPLAATR